MTFRRRVAFAFVGVMLVIVLMALSAFVTLRMVARSAEDVGDLTDDLSLVHDARLHTEQLVAVGRGYLLSGSQDMQDRLDTIDQQLRTTLEKLATRATHDERADLAELSQAANRYLVAIRRAANERLATGDPIDLERSFEDKLQPLRHQFEQLAEDLVRDEEMNAKSSMQVARSAANRAEISLGVLLAVALLGSLSLAGTIARRLISQYRENERSRDISRRASVAREEVLATVSHDLRTPLTAIGLGADLLQDAVATPQHQRALHSIVNAVTRMEHLIDDLLTREQLASGRIVLDRFRLDAGDLVETAIELHQQRASMKQVQLRCEMQGSAVDGDRERLLQVLSNLIGNSVKFARAADVVTVRVSQVDDATLFEVADTGPGIAAEALPHLFDRYFQGERRERGSLGLGLHICKRVVQAHGGAIGVESLPGRGTRIWFTIPAGKPTVDARRA